MRFVLPSLILLFSALAGAQIEEKGIAIDAQGRISFTGRAGKYLVDHLQRIEPDAACKKSRRCAALVRFGDEKTVVCDVGGKGGALAVYTCKVKAIPEDLAKKLFNELTAGEQTAVGNVTTRRLGHLNCEKEGGDFKCYVRALDHKALESCWIRKRGSRELNPPARICVYSTDGKLARTIESTDQDLRAGPHELLARACEPLETSVSTECPPEKPAAAGGGATTGNPVAN